MKPDVYKRQVYTFIIDGTNDRTYALKVTGSGDTQEWNRFLEV